MDTGKVYTSDKLTFIVCKHKIYIITTLQAFYIEPKYHYFRRRLNLISKMIEIDEIRDMNELVGWFGPGIELNATSRERAVRLCASYKV